MTPVFTIMGSELTGKLSLGISFKINLKIGDFDHYIYIPFEIITSDFNSKTLF